MYLSNTPASNTVYFPTVACNSHQFNRTTINHSFHYASLDSRHELNFLNLSNFNDLFQSGAAFASPFKENDPVLDQIDHEILLRNPGKPVPGGWCLGNSVEDKCEIWGDSDVLKPGVAAKRLERRLVEFLSNGTALSYRCVDEWFLIHPFFWSEDLGERRRGHEETRNKIHELFSNICCVKSCSRNLL